MHQRPVCTGTSELVPGSVLGKSTGKGHLDIRVHLTRRLFQPGHNGSVAAAGTRPGSPSKGVDEDEPVPDDDSQRIFAWTGRSPFEDFAATKRVPSTRFAICGLRIRGSKVGRRFIRQFMGSALGQDRGRAIHGFFRNPFEATRWQGLLPLLAPELAGRAPNPRSTRRRSGWNRL